MQRLIEVMARLRAPGGCPWDREQTPRTLRTYVLEEAYEVADAIDEGGWTKLREELGDLLLQVVFLARIAEEEGAFAFADVADGISEKLVRRHPHVFAEGDAKTVDEVWKKWEQIKEAERAEKAAARGEATASRLSGIPHALPALPKARLLADKAARAGFDWPDAAAIVDKLDEEVREIREALASGPPERVCEEIGDLVFATASLSRRLGLDPEACAEGANRKFASRFRAVEQRVAADGRTLEDLTDEEIDRYWEEAKRERPG